MYLSLRAGDISFCVAAAFLFGVFVANSGWNLWLTGALAVLILVMVALFLKVRTAWKFAALIAVAIVGGALYYNAYEHWDAAHTKMPTGKSAAFFGVVTAEPKAAGNFIMLAVGLSRPYAGDVDIFASPNGAQVHYGDEVWMSGTVTPSDNAGENPVVFLPRIKVVAEHEGFWLMEVMIDGKERIVAQVARMFPPDEAALLSGILIGTTGTVSAALKAQMETSGTTYIVNMYGYKMAIITSALAAILKDRLPRRAVLFVMFGAIVLFVMASGGAVSAVRAAVMGSLAVLARGTGRIFNARNAITFAAAGMVLANATLLTDAGFQLSFLSFLGIYYLGPPVNNFFRWTDRGVLGWKEHAMLSLTTNLAILPVVMPVFGEFSLTSFISNIFIMIPWAAVIAFGALAVALGYVASPLAFIATQLTHILLQYELFVIRVFSVIVLPMPAVFNSAFVTVFYFGTLILFAHYYAAPSQKDH